MVLFQGSGRVAVSGMVSLQDVVALVLLNFSLLCLLSHAVKLSSNSWEGVVGVKCEGDTAKSCFLLCLQKGMFPWGILMWPQPVSGCGLGSARMGITGT